MNKTILYGISAFLVGVFIAFVITGTGIDACGTENNSTDLCLYTGR